MDHRCVLKTLNTTLECKIKINTHFRFTCGEDKLGLCLQPEMTEIQKMSNYSFILHHVIHFAYCYIIHN